ncbi:MAG: hypothetical protein HY289_07090 [Planctomycetes bacterium]|nr:hypothetical protein [Planctomycetota bacterium]
MFFFLSLGPLIVAFLGSIYMFSLLPDPKRLDKLEDIKPEDRAFAEKIRSEARVTETVAVARLTQFMIGILIGAFLLCIGTYLSWVGIREKVDAGFTSKWLQANITALGPGMLLVLCGTLILAICLEKQFQYSATGGIVGNQPNVGAPPQVIFGPPPQVIIHQPAPNAELGEIKAVLERIEKRLPAAEKK